jgi:hypothetical protein
MSLEWLSWVVWAGLSVSGRFVSSISVELWVLAIGCAAVAAICLYGTGHVSDQWHENK